MPCSPCFCRLTCPILAIWIPRSPIRFFREMLATAALPGWRSMLSSPGPNHRPGFTSHVGHNGMESEVDVAQWHTIWSGSSLMTSQGPRATSAANSGFHPPGGGYPSNPYTLPHHRCPIVILLLAEEPSICPFPLPSSNTDVPSQVFRFLLHQFNLSLSVLVPPNLPLH